MGRKGIGNDICPDAYILTLAKANPPSKSSFLNYLRRVKERMPEIVGAELDNDDIRIYYSEKTLKEILALREVLKEDELKAFENLKAVGTDSLCRNVSFLKALMLGILHGGASFSLSLPMPHTFSMSPSYVKNKIAEDPTRFAKPERNVIRCLKAKSARVYKDPISRNFLSGEAYQCDAKELMLEEQVDLIITSPPYFTLHTYAWDNWIRLWFLGHNYKIVRKSLFNTNSERLYLEEMQKCLKTMNRLLKPDSRCFIVAGDVRGHKPIANLLADMVTNNEKIGFSVKRIIIDEIRRNRKYLYGSNSHHVKIDRILELHKGSPLSQSTDTLLTS